MHPLFPDNYQPWQAFISLNPNYCLEWGGLEKQERWGKLCLIATQRTANWFKLSPEKPTINEMVDFCAYERHKIALALDHKLSYGYKRLDDGFLGQRKSIFSEHWLRSKGQFQSLKDRFQKMTKVHSDAVIYLDNENKQPIMTISYSPGDQKESEKLTVYYPNSEQVHLLFACANAEWQALQTEKDKLSPQEKYIKLGEILWYLSISCPLVKGSSSTSEIIYHALTHELHLPLLPFKNAFSWDIYAMFTETPQEFAIWFYENMIFKDINDQEKFLLPSIDYEDHTNAITAEMTAIYQYDKQRHHRFYDESKWGIDSPTNLDYQYQTANLKDPYGLSLFHYYVLNYGKELNRDDSSLDIGSHATRFKMLPWEFNRFGNNMFFDALRINAPDPLSLMIKVELTSTLANSVNLLECNQLLLRGLEDWACCWRKDNDFHLPMALSILDHILARDPEEMIRNSCLNVKSIIGEENIDLEKLSSEFCRLLAYVRKWKVPLTIPQLSWLAKKPIFYENDKYYFLPISKILPKYKELNNLSLFDILLNSGKGYIFECFFKNDLIDKNELFTMLDYINSFTALSNKENFLKAFCSSYPYNEKLTAMLNEYMQQKQHKAVAEFFQPCADRAKLKPLFLKIFLETNWHIMPLINCVEQFSFVNHDDLKQLREVAIVFKKRLADKHVLDPLINYLEEKIASTVPLPSVISCVPFQVIGNR